MNPFPGPFLPRSSARAMFVPWARHWRWVFRSPEYRAWLRFNRQLQRHARRVAGDVVYRGRTIRFVDAPSFLSAWHEIFVAGLYDFRPDRGEIAPLVIDAGANIGLAALRWATVFPGCRYVGFEPDPEIAAVCRHNLVTWNCPGTLHQVALAGEDSRARFVRDGADSGALADTAGDSTAIEVETRRLASYLTEPVSLLKIDVEGAEEAVLADIEPHLAFVRRLFVEVHCRRGEPQSWGQLVGRLQQAGFRCYVRPLLPPWRPFVEPSPAGPCFDEQFNVFAVRSSAEPAPSA